MSHRKKADRKYGQSEGVEKNGGSAAMTYGCFCSSDTSFAPPTSSEWSFMSRRPIYVSC
ncbi:hypothetical protein P9850_13515 [Anoxybacillus rupiensis]|uniref:Uncharacterized protein n=1 Tax=Anoxybacteroides rupiense TaxID=311460 RepID=A0ABD5IYL0_9BACL|nr:hypothetical protein [Anoxybacillus rupiensis]